MDYTGQNHFELSDTMSSVRNFVIEQPMCGMGEGVASEDAVDCGTGTEDEEPEQKNLKPRPGKKTRGRVKIKFEYITKKDRRFTTFSKRKTGLMKKAYELSALTGTQVMLLVASETGHVYTFATRKLMPIVTSKEGKALIQTCLSTPDEEGHGGTTSSSSLGEGCEEVESKKRKVSVMTCETGTQCGDVMSGGLTKIEEAVTRQDLNKSSVHCSEQLSKSDQLVRLVPADDGVATLHRSLLSSLTTLNGTSCLTSINSTDTTHPQSIIINPSLKSSFSTVRLSTQEIPPSSAVIGPTSQSCLIGPTSQYSAVIGGTSQPAVIGCQAVESGSQAVVISPGSHGSSTMYLLPMNVSGLTSSCSGIPSGLPSSAFIDVNYVMSSGVAQQMLCRVSDTNQIISIPVDIQDNTAASLMLHSTRLSSQTTTTTTTHQL